MPRIAGVNIPENKQIETALTYIYGVGRPSARRILIAARIEPTIRASKLTPDQVKKLQEIIDGHHKVEGNLRREIMMNIKQLKEIGAWRGLRHLKGLPARGQRTRTNTRTIRGNIRKTVGSGRKPPPTPT